MIAEWTSKYVGLPYGEACWGPDYYDCWGLFSHVYREEFGIDVTGDMPPYEDDSEKIRRLQSKIVDWRFIKSPEEGDAILFMIGGRYPHCGIYVGDGRMLHSIKEVSSCVELIDSIRWKSRLEGYYRHNSRYS